jgi:hypothetical protein
VRARIFAEENRKWWTLAAAAFDRTAPAGEPVPELP